MRRTLELIFRHWVRIVMLLIIPIVLALAIAWLQPRQYESSATLFALQRYSVIGATGPEADLNSTAASTQATALTELLQTRSFDLAVANQTNLASSFDAATRADPNKLETAIEQELSTKVVVTPVGDHLYQITYASKYPQTGQAVVAAVVGRFGATASAFSIAEAKQLIPAYQAQLIQAQKTANDATRAAAAYAASHPASTAQNDPTYNQLLQQAQGTQATVGSLEGNITQLNQEIAAVGNGNNGLYVVVDPPHVNSQPISRTKTLALGAVIGATIGLLAITLMLVAFMRRDRATYSPDDMRRVSNLPVVLELPELPPAVIAAAAQARPRLLE